MGVFFLAFVVLYQEKMENKRKGREVLWTVNVTNNQSTISSKHSRFIYKYVHRHSHFSAGSQFSILLQVVG